MRKIKLLILVVIAFAMTLSSVVSQEDFEDVPPILDTSVLPGFYFHDSSAFTLGDIKVFEEDQPEIKGIFKKTKKIVQITETWQTISRAEWYEALRKDNIKNLKYFQVVLERYNLGSSNEAMKYVEFFILKPGHAYIWYEGPPSGKKLTEPQGKPWTKWPVCYEMLRIGKPIGDKNWYRISGNQDMIDESRLEIMFIKGNVIVSVKGFRKGGLIKGESVFDFTERIARIAASRL